MQNVNSNLNDKLNDIVNLGIPKSRESKFRQAFPALFLNFQ